MRIVHSTLRYPPASGGAETYVRDIVEHTRSVEDKRDVRVLTSRLRTHGPISELSPDDLANDPPYVQRLHYMRIPFVSYPRFQALPYYLKHHAPDIIHGYGFWYHPADGAARFAQKHTIPFIFHPLYYENPIRQKPIWQLYKHAIGKKTFAAADVVVVISPYEQALIEKADFSVKRFEQIPPGIDTDIFLKSHTSPFQKRGISGNILLTVSRIAPGKGLDELIASLPAIIRAHPTTQLVLAGEDFGIQKSLWEQATSLGVAKHVHFLGKLSRAELIGAYQHANLFVHPSHYEAFGIVLAEAQAAGTPVVARNVSAIPFVAPENYGAKLFSTQDELSNHIIKGLHNSSKQSATTDAARNYIQQHFSWSVISPKLLKLYDELIQ